jgi:hypothetical protein
MTRMVLRPLLLIGFWQIAVDARAQTQTAAATEGFRFMAGAQYQDDSNFSRTAEAGDEQISRAGVGLGYTKSISAQQFAAKVVASEYRYAQREYLDENSWEGSASWRSQFTSAIRSLLEYERTEIPVDQLEFNGRDHVARENANAQITLGNNRRLAVLLGAHYLQQTHSNLERSYLDFSDEDVFAELRYKGQGDSWVGLRYRNGERNYDSLTQAALLNFDYRQWEIETRWQLTPKTQVQGLAGYFERRGDNNDDEGALASVSWSWQTTSKLTADISYSISQPALGETTDAPNEIKNTSLLLRWQWSEKLQLSSGVSYTEFDYLNPQDLSIRIERNVSVTPLAIEWQLSPTIRLRAHSQWMERKSPMLVRAYDGHVITGGLALAF